MMPDDREASLGGEIPDGGRDVQGVDPRGVQELGGLARSGIPSSLAV